MTRQPAVDRLLDQWELEREINPQLSLDRFISEQLTDTEPTILSEFRSAAEKLAAADEHLKRWAASEHAALQTDAHSASNDTHPLEGIRVGSEPISGYRLVSRLRSRGFGEVWKAQSPGGFHVALKFVNLDGRASDLELRSLELMKEVRHPHLLSIFGAWQRDDFLIIATELADGTLLDRLQAAQSAGHSGIPIEELMTYMAESAKGIDVLNNQGNRMS